MARESEVARHPLIEHFAVPRAGLRRLWHDLGLLYGVNGLIGLIFAATGPVAVILAVGVRGGLSQAEIASWIFGVFFVNGILTVLACWLYQQPLSFFWTIPGTILVGPALGHLRWPEVVGAFFATGVFILVLGLTGWVRVAMKTVPMPIVMGMVAGVFLRFGTDLIRAMIDNPAVALPMVAAFLLLSAHIGLGRRLPPVVGALVAGGIAVAVTGQMAFDTPGAAPDTGQVLASPVFTMPAWSGQAMVELVIPLAITVLVVQNGQGVAVLRVAGHNPPVNFITIACGVWSLLTAFVGSVSTCLTGPTNALLTASGERGRQYTAGICCGLLAIVFGLFAPFVTRAMLAAPAAFIAVLAGVAMLRVLQASFVTAFASRFTLGALVAFVVTVTDVTLLRIGAAFWGLVAGLLVSLLLERADFAATRGS